MSSMRLGFIGPLLPWRSGIAQHSTLLVKALSDKADVLPISFRRQYPDWLYPGAFQREAEETLDASPLNIQYTLTPFNPLTWCRALDRMMTFAPDRVILPWWTVFWTPCFAFLASRFRARRVPVCFICHNIQDHERASWKAMLSTFTLHRGTCFVAHSRRDAQWLSTKFPEAKVQFYPHPLYDHFPPSDNALPRRSKLELLFFGLVRPYKGLDVLASTMEELKGLDVFLTVAGEWWTKDPSLRDRLLATGQVEILDSYAPPSTVARLFTRADVVVLPYREVTGSGVLSIAYHYAKPVIATRTGGFPDVVTDGVSGRLVPPGDPKALASAVREFLKDPPPGTPEGVRETAVQMTFAGLADCVLDLVREKGPPSLPIAGRSMAVS